MSFELALCGPDLYFLFRTCESACACVPSHIYLVSHLKLGPFKVLRGVAKYDSTPVEM